MLKTYQTGHGVFPSAIIMTSAVFTSLCNDCTCDAKGEAWQKGIHTWGIPKMLGLFHGKSDLEMDDDWG